MFICVFMTYTLHVHEVFDEFPIMVRISGGLVTSVKDETIPSSSGGTCSRVSFGESVINLQF